MYNFKILKQNIFLCPGDILSFNSYILTNQHYIKLFKFFIFLKKKLKEIWYIKKQNKLKFYKYINISRRIYLRNKSRILIFNFLYINIFNLFFILVYKYYNFIYHFYNFYKTNINNSFLKLYNK